MFSQAMLAPTGIDLKSIKKVAVGFGLSPLVNSRVDLLTVCVYYRPLLAKAQSYGNCFFLPYALGFETSSEVLLIIGVYLA